MIATKYLLKEKVTVKWLASASSVEFLKEIALNT